MVRDMKLWHDDVRSPPAGWVWVQNNDDAKLVLATGSVVEISLDHDMGASPEDGILAAGQHEDNGLRLVVWMVEKVLVPKVVTIHSWNPAGAKRMMDALADAGYVATYSPWSAT